MATSALPFAAGSVDAVGFEGLVSRDPGELSTDRFGNRDWGLVERFRLSYLGFLIMMPLTKVSAFINISYHGTSSDTKIPNKNPGEVFEAWCRDGLSRHLHCGDPWPLRCAEVS